MKLFSFREPIRRAAGIAREVLRNFGRDNGGLLAAAVSFYAFLSLVPALLLGIGTAGFVLGSHVQSENLIVSWVEEQGLPPQAGEQVSAVVREVIAGRGKATGIGILLLLWTVSSGLGNLERAINIAWNVERKRGFAMRRLLGLAACAVVGVLLILSFGATAALRVAKGLDIRIMGTSPANWPWVWDLAGFAVPLTVTIASFTAIYKLLPNTFVPVRAAFLGGLFAGLLWETAKLAFSYYVDTFADYSRVYGSLGGVILLMVWIHYSAVVTILGAELAASTAQSRGRPDAGR